MLICELSDFVLFVFRRTMADTKAVTIRTRKFMTNRLLSRKQFVSSILHTAFVFLNLDLYIGFHVDLFGFRETVLKENESSYLRFWSYYFFYFILFYWVYFLPSVRKFNYRYNCISL